MTPDESQVEVLKAYTDKVRAEVRTLKALASLRRVAGMLVKQRKESKRLWDVLNAADTLDQVEAEVRITRCLAWAARQESNLASSALDALDGLKTILSKRAVDLDRAQGLAERLAHQAGQAQRELAHERGAHERTREKLERVTEEMNHSCPDCEMARRLEVEQQAHERTREALRGLVRINEDWNRNVEAVIGRPVGWTDSYLDAARAALAPEKGGE